MYRLLFACVIVMLLIAGSSAQAEPEIFNGATPPPPTSSTAATTAATTAVPKSTTAHATSTGTHSSTAASSTTGTQNLTTGTAASSTTAVPKPTTGTSNHTNTKAPTPTPVPTPNPIYTVYGVAYSDKNCTQSELSLEFHPTVGSISDICQTITEDGVSAGFMTSVLDNNKLVMSCVYTSAGCDPSTLDYCQNYTLGECTQIVENGVVQQQWSKYTLLTASQVTSAAPALGAGLLGLVALALLF